VAAKTRIPSSFQHRSTLPFQGAVLFLLLLPLLPLLVLLLRLLLLLLLELWWRGVKNY
jgi:hypothetical protein